MRTLMHKLILGCVWLLSFATLLGLGTWQMQRLAWKEGLIAQQEAMQTQVPRPLQQVLDTEPETAYQFQPVHFQGVFQPGKQIKAGPFILDGQSGYRQVAAFKVQEAGFYSNHTLWVQLGWHPYTATPEPPLPEVPLTLTGTLWMPEPQPRFTADNKPDLGQWPHIDPAAMSSFHGTKPFLPLTVVLAAESLQKLGVAGLEPLPATVPLRNNHFNYAMTWYSLALVMLAVTLVAWRRRV